LRNSNVRALGGKGKDKKSGRLSIRGVEDVCGFCIRKMERKNVLVEEPSTLDGEKTINLYAKKVKRKKNDGKGSEL